MTHSFTPFPDTSLNLNVTLPFVSQQLRQKESEIEQERRMREDLMQRLAALQQHVVGHDHDQTDSQFSTMPSVSGDGTIPTKTMLSEEELQRNMVEQEAAKKRCDTPSRWTHLIHHHNAPSQYTLSMHP